MRHNTFGMAVQANRRAAELGGPSSVVETACPLDCPDACSLAVTVQRGRIVAIDGSHKNPVTGGYICAKVRRFGERVYGVFWDGLGAGIKLFLEVGPETIESYLLELSNYLAERLTSKGYEVVSPRGASEMSAIVTCKHDRHTPRELYRLLRAKNILTAPRVNRLRISPHFYNTREEVDALVDALPD